MDLRGDAKIQALFSDLMLEDQSVAPVFEKLCRGARAGEPERQQARGRSLVLVTAVAVIATLCSLAWWYSNTANRRLDRKALSEFSATGSIPVVPLIARPGSRALDRPAKTIQATHEIHKAAGRRPTRTAGGDAVLQKAAVISSWQSPTAILMDSPAGSALKLPQLNQSKRELEAFLPAAVKELSQ